MRLRLRLIGLLDRRSRLAAKGSHAAMSIKGIAVPVSVSWAVAQA